LLATLFNQLFDIIRTSLVPCPQNYKAIFVFSNILSYDERGLTTIQD
jgi:hypothetical protein